MAEGSRSGWSAGQGVLPLVALTFLGVTGLVASTQPLVAPRPAAVSAATTPLAGNAARARLWEDPIGAVERHIADVQAGRVASPASSPSNDRPMLRPGDHVFAIVVNGDAYPEAIESRVEDRVAVHAALAEAGYQPKDADRLGYFFTRSHHTPLATDAIRGGAVPAVPSPGAPAMGDAQSDHPAPTFTGGTDSKSATVENQAQPAAGSPIAFEVFRSIGPTSALNAQGTTQSTGSKYVLWIRSDQIAWRRQLQVLAGLKHELQRDELNAHADAPRWTMIVGSSNALVDAIVEDAELERTQLPPAPGSVIEALAGVEILNFSATVASSKLVENLLPWLPAEGTSEHAGFRARMEDESLRAYQTAGRESDTRELLHDWLVQTYWPGGCRLATGAVLRRTIGTDKQLTDLIVRELELRGVALEDSRHHVVVFHPQETVYGASFTRTLAASIDESRGIVAGLSPALPPNVHQYAYLRQIDGRLPGESASPATTAGSGPSGSAVRAGETEEPVGRQQFDYLRRAAEEISQRDRLLRCTGERVVAVVFVGGVFDKLPLVQAIREGLPDALIVTTDHHAFWSHPRYYPVTRNVLVASHFDLQLDRTIQAITPPRRNAYATSLMFGILARVVDDDQTACSPQVTKARGIWLTRADKAKLSATSAVVGRHLAHRANDATSQSERESQPKVLRTIEGPVALGTAGADASTDASGGHRAELETEWRNHVADIPRHWARMFEIARSGAVDLNAAELEHGHFPSTSTGNRSALRRLQSTGVTFLLVFGITFLALRGWRWFGSAWRTDPVFGDPACDPLSWNRARPDAITAATVALFIALMAMLREWAPGDEPLRLRDGISIWPSLYLRFTVCAIGIGHLVHLWLKSGRGGDAGAFDRFLAAKSPDPAAEASRASPGAPPPSLIAAPAYVTWRASIIASWQGALTSSIIALIVLMPLILWAVDPQSLSRSPWLRRLDVAVDVIAYVLLVIVVMLFLATARRSGRMALDLATKLCAGPIWNLRWSSADWLEPPPPDADHPVGLSGRAGDAWLSVKLLAARTRWLSETVYVPFVMAGLLWLSHYTGFDHWQVRTSSIVLWVLLLTLVAAAAFLLQQTVQTARARMIESLEQEEWRRRAAPAPGGVGTKDRLERARTALLAINDGAFAPYTSNPVVRALLIPFGGFGAIQLAQFVPFL